MMRRTFWAKRIFHIWLALLPLSLTAQTGISEPFGLLAVATQEEPLWTTWRDLQLEISAGQPVIAHCRVDPHACPPAALQFIAIVNEGNQYEGFARIGHINRAVNFAIRGTNNVLSEEWTSPLATLEIGDGDCKQYAILKYAALNDAGFGFDDLRIVIVEDKSLHRQHAVVAVRNEGRWLVLDNRSSMLLESSEVTKRYVPLTALDWRGVREFIPSQSALKTVSVDSD